MGYGNGYPLFNYYAPFPYYIGAFLSYLAGFIFSAKLLFVVPIFLGSFSMFLLAKELFGVYSGVLASILFTYTPYRALNIFVRGDVTESFALSIIPLVFYFAFKLIKFGGTGYFIGLSLSLAAFLISHNIMTVLFMPIFLLITLYWLLIQKGKHLRYLVLGLLLGTGISAFFILPAYFEKNLVQIDNLIRLDLNFRAHFVTLNQLFFSRFWGYGASVLGSGDTISFQIGWPHWWITIFSGIVFLIGLRSKPGGRNFLPAIFIMFFLFSVFMTHNKSAFIWERIDILKFTQFPWRFLAVATFATSLLGGYAIQNLKYAKYIMIFLIILTIVLNFNYFKPKEFYPDLTDKQKLSGLSWDEQSKAAILDFLPQTAVQPREPAPDSPFVESGNALISGFQNKSNNWQFHANVTDDAVIQVPVLDFPNWQVFANGKRINHSNKNYLGRIKFTLAHGQYSVVGKFGDTQIRTISNIISLISIVIMITIYLYGNSRKDNR